MNKNKKQSASRRAKNGWKILFKYLFEYKKSVILLSVLGVISALANGTVPYIIGKFFDAVLDPTALIFIGTQIEMPMWALLIGIFATVQIVADVVDWVNGKEKGRIAENIYADYISNAFSRRIKFPMSFHKEKKSGDVNQTINRAADTIYSLIENLIVSLAPQFLSVVVGFVIVLYMNSFLSFVLLGGVAFYVLTLTKTVGQISKLTKKANKLYRKAFGSLQDILSNFEAVKKFGTENVSSKKMEHRFIDTASAAWHKVLIVNVNVAFYQKIIVTITRVFIFIFSINFLKDGTITIGELIAFNGYAGMVFGPFVQLSTNWQKIQKDIGVLEDTEKILNTPPEIYEPENAVPMKDIRGEVEFRGVHFHYTKKDGDVLNGLDVHVKPGEVVALVGESGVGKSTFIELISAYYFAQKGKVLVDGVDVKRIPLADLRGAIAVVPQEVALFNDTILANIKYGSFNASNKEVMEAARKAHADVFIEKFPKKYKQVVGERGIKLSVGQKQRIAIARAILRNPKILVLDEPTSALDAQTEQFITDSLHELMKGRTTFIVAHRLSTVREADKILVFEKGRIVESGKHTALIQKEGGAYKKLYDLQIGLS